MNVLSPEFVAAIGLLLGVLARVSIPYLIKLWTGEIKEFQIYYIWQGLAGLALSAIIVLLVAPSMLIAPNASFFQLIATNAVIGLGSTELISEIFTLRDLKKEPITATPPT